MKSKCIKSLQVISCSYEKLHSLVPRHCSQLFSVHFNKRMWTKLANTPCYVEFAIKWQLDVNIGWLTNFAMLVAIGLTWPL